MTSVYLIYEAWKSRRCAASKEGLACNNAIQCVPACVLEQQSVGSVHVSYRCLPACLACLAAASNASLRTFTAAAPAHAGGAPPQLQLPACVEKCAAWQPPEPPQLPSQPALPADWQQQQPLVPPCCPCQLLPRQAPSPGPACEGKCAQGRLLPLPRLLLQQP